MTDTQITEARETERLLEAAARYYERRELAQADLALAMREVGAFAAGWNACREAMSDAILAAEAQRQQVAA